MLAFAATTGSTIAIIIIIAVGAWLIGALTVAIYGANRHFRFAPLLICSLLVGFPVVLLAIAIMTPLLDQLWEQKIRGD